MLMTDYILLIAHFVSDFSSSLRAHENELLQLLDVIINTRIVPFAPRNTWNY